MPESGTLDFKQAQYPFAGVSDDAKSERLKDIVAFANAWKNSDALIVISAADGRGLRATNIQGANLPREHLDTGVHVTRAGHLRRLLGRRRPVRRGHLGSLFVEFDDGLESIEVVVDACAPVCEA